jgi:hypothetical protein
MTVLDVRSAPEPPLLDRSRARTRSDAAVRVGAALTSAGQRTGPLASVLLLAQVVLMAQVPVLERAVGQDALARVHRMVEFSFNLVLAHVGLITLGYAAGSVGAGPGRSGS